jgi:hypothetical protein
MPKLSENGEMVALRRYEKDTMRKSMPAPVFPMPDRRQFFISKYDRFLTNW